MSLVKEIANSLQIRVYYVVRLISIQHVLENILLFGLVACTCVLFSDNVLEIAVYGIFLNTTQSWERQVDCVAVRLVAKGAFFSSRISFLNFHCKSDHIAIALSSFKYSYRGYSMKKCDVRREAGDVWQSADHVTQ